MVGSYASNLRESIPWDTGEVMMLVVVADIECDHIHDSIVAVRFLIACLNEVLP